MNQFCYIVSAVRRQGLSKALEEHTVPPCCSSKACESWCNGSCLLSTYEAAAEYEPTLVSSSRGRRIVREEKDRRGGEGSWQRRRCPNLRTPKARLGSRRACKVLNCVTGALLKSVNLQIFQLLALPNPQTALPMQNPA